MDINGGRCPPYNIFEVVFMDSRLRRKDKLNKLDSSFA